MNEPRCYECDHPFTDVGWENRHTSEEGEDVHERCCLVCEPHYLRRGDTAPAIRLTPGQRKTIKRASGR